VVNFLVWNPDYVFSSITKFSRKFSRFFNPVSRKKNRFVNVRFIFYLFMIFYWFRFVSFLLCLFSFRFVSARFVSFRFCFVSYFTITQHAAKIRFSMSEEGMPAVNQNKSKCVCAWYACACMRRYICV
jgi:hypothetical protein